MKEYPKTYEDFYQRTSKINLATPELFHGGLSREEFSGYYEALLRGYFKDVWLAAVRYVWLTYHFKKETDEMSWGEFRQRGRREIGSKKKWGALYRNVGALFGKFPRYEFGIDRRVMAEGFAFRESLTFVADLFPKEILLSKNPFEEPEFFKLPYSSVTLDLLLPVYQMSERLELLEIAEERKMRWPAFMDYVLNYIHSYNEEFGKRIFTVISRQPYPVYFRDARYTEAMRKIVLNGVRPKGHVQFEERHTGIPKL